MSSCLPTARNEERREGGREGEREEGRREGGREGRREGRERRSACESSNKVYTERWREGGKEEGREGGRDRGDTHLFLFSPQPEVIPRLAQAQRIRPCTDGGGCRVCQQQLRILPPSLPLSLPPSFPSLLIISASSSPSF